MEEVMDLGDDEEPLGPIDYLVVEFPDGVVMGRGFAALIGLVDQGAIQVLDLEFLAKRADGSVSRVDLSDVATRDVDLAAWHGATTRILDDGDLAAVGEAISPGAIAAVLVYEELTMSRVVTAWQLEGARVVGLGGVSVDDLLDALDATDPQPMEA